MQIYIEQMDQSMPIYIETKFAMIFPWFFQAANFGAPTKRQIFARGPPKSSQPWT